MVEDGSAVGDAEEDGLAIVPCGVHADGPPQGSGSPQAEAEDQRGNSRADESRGAFAGVGAVDCSKAERDDEGRDPEADRTRIGGAWKIPDETGEATSQRVLEIAAEEIFLKESDGEEAGNPEKKVVKNRRTEEQSAVDNEQAGL